LQWVSGEGIFIEKNIIPQDIGRVLLNLDNNAFYAVYEKMKTADEDYQPSVSVVTKKLDDKLILTVMDNGNGILQKVVDKIFQPFFTTKPQDKELDWA
jgi:two-component system, NtrC family, sensor kinase